MRTTITLDDDVAVLIEERRRQRRGTFKQIVNEALRAGLTQTATRKPKKKSWTTTYDPGPPLIPIDSISDALELAEGPWYR
jgi:hypothetical protein